MNRISRRQFLGKYFTGGVLTMAGSWILFGCNNPEKEAKKKTTQNENPEDPCSDLSGIAESEIKKREQLGYVKESPHPESNCQNCNLYVPPENEDACAGCMLFKGPVQEEGYCTYWAPQSAS